MSPYTLVERPFHVIVKHTMATETSGNYQPGNIALLCGPSTHRTEIFCLALYLYPPLADFIRAISAKTLLGLTGFSQPRLVALACQSLLCRFFYGNSGKTAS